MEHDGGSFLMSKVDRELIQAQKKVIINRISLMEFIFRPIDAILSLFLYCLPDISVSEYRIKMITVVVLSNFWCDFYSYFLCFTCFFNNKKEHLKIKYNTAKNEIAQR